MHRGGASLGGRIDGAVLPWVAAGLLAYAIGSIPTAFLVTRYFLGRDIRGLGDHNGGAANVFRNVGAKAGLTVGAIDIIKGGVAVLAVKALFGHTGMEIMGGFLAVVGHCLPVYLRLRGGRGAATAVGVLIAVLPLITLPIGALSLVALYYTRKAIVALAMFLIAVPLLAWPAGYPLEVALYALAVPIMVGVSHFLLTRVVRPRLEARTSAAGE